LNISKWPISCIAGVAVIVLYCAFTFTSWALYPTPYSPVDNWLSDLGNSTYNPSGAILYNLGCILTGIALFPFFGGLYKWYTNDKGRRILLMITQAIGLFAAFSLVMIGVFSEDSGELHILWSSIFFLLNLLVLILMGVSLFTHPNYMKPIAYSIIRMVHRFHCFGICRITGLQHAQKIQSIKYANEPLQHQRYTQVMLSILSNKQSANNVNLHAK